MEWNTSMHSNGKEGGGFDDGTTVACQWYACLDTDVVTRFSVSYELSFLVLH